MLIINQQKNCNKKEYINGVKYKKYFDSNENIWLKQLEEVM